MKLALIAPAPIPANTANSIQVMKMAQAYARLGHKVCLFAPGKLGEVAWDALAEHYGLSQPFAIERLPANRALRGYDYAYRAVRRARHWGAALIHTRLPQAAAWAADNGLPTIYELHDLPSGFMGPRLFRLFTQAQGARALVVVSQALAEALKGQFPQLKADNLLRVHPDGVDVERYKSLPPPPVARQQLDLPDAFTLGYTGHLYAGRGVQLILQLAAQLPDLRFLLVGGHPVDVERVRSQIAEQQLANITLTGFVPNAQLPLYQAASDVLLMPYQARVAASSGGDIAAFLSPMKMFEYLAAGRPILASDLPVLAEVLTPQNAIILPQDDPQRWIDAIQRLAADPKSGEQIAAAARRTAARHTWEQRAAAILKGIPAHA